MRATTLADIDKLRAGIQRIGKLSDNIVSVGPFGIGIGGLLAWIPVLGPAYSLIAAVLLVVSGFRARAPASVLGAAIAMLAARTLFETFADLIPPPFSALPDVAVDLFRAHRWAANLLTKAIDDTLYIEGPADAASVTARGGDTLGGDKRRVVFLG